MTIKPITGYRSTGIIIPIVGFPAVPFLQKRVADQPRVYLMMNHSPDLKDIDSALLTPLVRHMLGNPAAEIVHWEHHPISYINTEESNLGLHRFQGTAQVQSEIDNWSMALKAVHAPFNDTDPTCWNYHRREMLAYEDGLLAELPGGLRTPRCLGITEHPDGTCWLWLEDLKEAATDASWSLDEYKIAAHHLGRFNGAYLTGHSLPDQRWLSQNWIQGWLDFYDTDCKKTLELIREDGFWERPVLKPAFSRSITDDVLKLWGNHHQLLVTLAQLPKTFCHMDAYRPNLFIRRNEQGVYETVAIDWVFAGIGGVGEDIANLLAASLIWFEYDASDAKHLDEAVFTGYLNGLREAGWQGNAQLARLGYTSACALRWGVVSLWWLNSLIDPEKHAEFEGHWNHPVPDLVQQWAHTTCYVLRLAEEADELQHALL